MLSNKQFVYIYSFLLKTERCLYGPQMYIERNTGFIICLDSNLNSSYFVSFSSGAKATAWCLTAACSSSRCAKVMNRMNSSLPDETDTTDTSTWLSFSRSSFILSGKQRWGWVFKENSTYSRRCWGHCHTICDVRCCWRAIYCCYFIVFHLKESCDRQITKEWNTNNI